MSRPFRAVRGSIFGIVFIAATQISLCSLMTPVFAHEPADWPGLRGARVDGVSAETNVFGSGGVRLDVAWKRPIGKGYSSVSVADGRVVTMFSDGQSDVVIALDAADGRELWRYPIGETYRGHDGSQDGPISTPFVADGRVFALGPRGKLVALDAVSGQEIWKTELVKDHGAVKPHWGFGTSPLVASGVLVVEFGAKGAMVCGFDPQTGKRLWAAGDDDVYYQSPVPFSQEGRPRLLVAGNKKLLCVDPKSGDVLWEYLHDGGGEYGAICMVPVPLDEHRILLDHKDDTCLVLEITREGAKADFKCVWEQRAFSKSYSVGVHHAGYLYGYNGRTSTCVDARTGQRMWRSRQPGDGFPIVVDDHLVILTKEGSLHVAKAATGGYQETARLQVFTDLCWSPPSFARGSIFVRSFGELARIDVRRGAPPTLATRDAGPAIAGTRFAEFLRELGNADDKQAAIDRFLSTSGPFPMIEPDSRLVFVYRGPGQDLAIGGDLTGFGKKLRMHRVPGTDLFYAVARLEPDARVSYAFVRDFKAILDPLNPRKTTAAGFDDDLEFTYTEADRELSWLAMPDWKPPTHLAEPDAARRGRIESHKIKSAALDAEVAFDVYTPAGYTESTERLPVAYLHGGQLARDQLRIPTALDNLIGRRVAPLIAVFINRDPPFFNFEAYAKMCAEELPAFIDANYRTVPSREGRAHIASGPGAMATLHVVLAHGSVADKLAVQSPWIVQVSALDPIMKNASEAPLTVYLDWGKYDTRSPLEFWSVGEMAGKLDQYFRDHGYRPIGGEAHDGGGAASWQNRTDDLFEALFPIRQVQ